MFNELGGMVQRAVSGEIDQNQVSEAATDQVQNMDHDQLKDQLQQTADNASAAGDTNIAQTITNLLQQHGGDHQTLQGEVVSLITNNPQILQHLAPGLAEGILGRLKGA